MTFLLKFVCLLLMSTFLGCGYHFGTSGHSEVYHTISIPFIEGDEDGTFTSTLIEQLVQSGHYTYVSEGGALTLKVKLIDFNDENIGFRYDRKKDGRRRKAIIPTEARLTSSAEVTLVESCSGTPLIGPVIINASIDFDHNYYLGRGEVNVFSLGQLNDYDIAYEDAYKPLGRALAQKVVDLVNDSW